MKRIGTLFIITGIVFIGYFGYQYISLTKAENQTLVEAKKQIQQHKDREPKHTQITNKKDNFTADHLQAFGTLEIPRLNKTIGIVEGADEQALAKGVGHMSQTVFPGQDNQIVLSGHRDTVFRNFRELKIGDPFTVHMPYGDYRYKIKNTKIVPEDDTSVVRKKNNEELVVSTCYPFRFIGNAPKRFVAYAYPD